MMTQIAVIDIEKKLITPLIEKKIKKISKFYEVYGNKALIILIDSANSPQFLNGLITDLSENGKITIETCILNSIAKNRLINNFEKERPELSFILIGCSDMSTLTKIWNTNAK